MAGPYDSSRSRRAGVGVEKSHLLEERGCVWRSPQCPAPRPPRNDAGAQGGPECGRNREGRLRGKGESCRVFSPGRQREWKASCGLQGRACAEVRLGGGVGAQPLSHLRSTQSSRRPSNRPSPSSSLPPPPLQAGEGCRDWGRTACPAGGAGGSVPARGLSPLRSWASFGFGPVPRILTKSLWASRPGLCPVPSSHQSSEPRGWSLEASDCRPFGKGM